MPNTVVLKGDPLYKEARAGEANIRPGMILERDSAGEVVSHINAGRDTFRMFAIENRDIGEGVDDLYADNDRVHYIVARPGDEVRALLAAGTGGDVAIGAILESDGAGALLAHTPVSIVESGTATKSVFTRAAVGVALEAIDNDPGSGGVAVPINIEVI